MELHFYQSKILEKLLYNQSLKFSDLRIAELSSKHFNYHLSELVKLELIKKNSIGYELTNLGKEYLDKVDTENMRVEVQPKVNVGIVVERTNSQGVTEYLCSKRLKHPFFGKVAGISGKVRFGEQFEDAARRELLEETGLTGDFQLCKVVRKIAHSVDEVTKEPNIEVVQDQVMFLFKVTNPRGNFTPHIKVQENFWQTYAEIIARKDVFKNYVTYIDFCNSEKMDLSFEEVTTAEGF